MSPSPVISSSRKSTQSRNSRQSNQAIDDPIRLYLLQMGSIPLLNRDGEVQSARQIEHWRRRYRHELLGNDYALRSAVKLLEQYRQYLVTNLINCCLRCSEPGSIAMTTASKL